jgi:hypothetical protein
MRDGEYHLYGLASVLPDEHFASVLLRSAQQQCAPIYEVLPFGRGTAVRYASHLKAFHQSLPAKGTLPRDVLQRLCLYPYIAPFIEPRSRVRHLRWALAEPELRPGLGLRSGRPPQPKFFRLCPACFAEESRKSVPYFHRSHQLPGINFCPVHNLMLVDSPTDMRFFTALPASECPPPTERVKANVPKDLARYVQNALEHLATANSFKLPAYNFRQLYEHLFSNRRPNKAQIDGLIQQVEARYGEYLIPAFSWDTWSRPSLFHFLREAKTSESLSLVSHLVLFHFLGIPFEQALERAALRSQWPCPNGYCLSYGQFSLDRPIPTKTSLVLRCPVCEIKFGISRNTPPWTRLKKISVLEAGLLGKKVVEALKSGSNQRQIADEAHLPETLIAQIARVLAGFKTKVKGKRLFDPENRSRRLRNHKQRVSQWLREHPSATRLQFVQALTGSCRFLKTADPAWLEMHAPARRPRGRRVGEKRRSK